MSISVALDPYFLCRKIEKPWQFPEEMDGKLLICTRVGIFCFDILPLKSFSLFCTLNWPINNYASRQGKVINMGKEFTILLQDQYHRFDYRLTEQIATSCLF